MQDGDIASDSPSTLWVMSDLVLDNRPSVVLGEDSKRSWRRPKQEPVSEVVTLDSLVMSRIWKYTESTQGAIKMELVHISSRDEDADRLLELMDTAEASPIGNVLVFQDVVDVQASLPYRPDVIGVIDHAANLLRWGSLGRTMLDLV